MAISQIAKESGPDPRKGPPCMVCAALGTLTKADAAALRQLLADSTWRYTELSDRLRDDPDTPLDIHPHTLSRHAKGRCAAREKLR